MAALADYSAEEILAMSGRWIRHTETGELAIIRHAMQGTDRIYMKLTIPSRGRASHTNYSNPINWETTNYPPAWNPDGTPIRTTP